LIWNPSLVVNYFICIIAISVILAIRMKSDSTYIAEWILFLFCFYLYFFFSIIFLPVTSLRLREKKSPGCVKGVNSRGDPLPCYRSIHATADCHVHDKTNRQQLTANHLKEKRSIIRLVILYSVQLECHAVLSCPTCIGLRL
jgi:hypothetical protein